ncbi:MAG: isoprenyl transferase [Actinomycetaceae bacterium]|nr:isoprenyl transferase [Actinomycetaceae bacterium]
MNDISLHRKGCVVPSFKKELLPQHIAIVMDGNGRWANERSLPRTEGHKVGESVLLDVIAGGLEVGVKEISAFAFSTENWKRSPAEVRFIMGFSRDVLARQRDILHEWGVKVRWIGRKPRLWETVLHQLKEAEELTKNNTRMTFNLAINYGGRAEIADAAQQIANDVTLGVLKTSDIDESTISRYLYAPFMNDVDLFIRTGGEQRTSNFLMWESAYAEFFFSEKLWPDFTREDLWEACEAYMCRDRRFGGAVDKVVSHS